MHFKNAAPDTFAALLRCKPSKSLQFMTPREKFSSFFCRCRAFSRFFAPFHAKAIVWRNNGSASPASHIQVIHIPSATYSMEAKFPLLRVFKLHVHARRAHESILILNYDTETVNLVRLHTERGDAHCWANCALLKVNFHPLGAMLLPARWRSFGSCFILHHARWRLLSPFSYLRGLQRLSSAQQLWFHKLFCLLPDRFIKPTTEKFDN